MLPPWSRCEAQLVATELSWRRTLPSGTKARTLNRQRSHVPRSKHLWAIDVGIRVVPRSKLSSKSCNIVNRYNIVKEKCYNIVTEKFGDLQPYW